MWQRFLNNSFQLVRDLVVGDGSPGAKSLKFNNGAIPELEIPADAVPRKWVLPPNNNGGTVVIRNFASLEIFNHFMGGFGDLQTNVSGANAFVFTSVADTEGTPGMAQLHTGTTASGRAHVGTSVNPIQLGRGFCRTEASLRIPIPSTSTETFTCRFGFMNSNSGEPTNGVFIRYTNAVNNGNWQFVSRINNVETIVNTNIAPTTVQWQKIRIDILSDGSIGYLYVNDVLIDNLNTSGLTITPNRQVGIAAIVIKSLGTNAGVFHLDYLYIGINL